MPVSRSGGIHKWLAVLVHTNDSFLVLIKASFRVGTKQDLARLRESGQFVDYARENFNPELVELVDNWIKQSRNNPQMGSKFNMNNNR